MIHQYAINTGRQLQHNYARSGATKIIRHPGGLPRHHAAAAADTIRNIVSSGDGGDGGGGSEAAPPMPPVCTNGTRGQVINGQPIPFPLFTLTPEACCVSLGVTLLARA